MILLDHALPVEPLMEITRAENQSDLARLCGVSVRAAHRWHHRGLQWWVADEIANRLGYHPASVWGMAWWAIPNDEDGIRQAEKKRRERRELVRQYELMYRALGVA